MDGQQRYSQASTNSEVRTKRPPMPLPPPAQTHIPTPIPIKVAIPKNVPSQSYSGSLPTSWDVSGTIGSLGDFVYSAVGAVTTNITQVVKSNLLDDNHPWKQEKYKCALDAWRAGFKELSTLDPDFLLKMLNDTSAASTSPLAEAVKNTLSYLVQNNDDHRSTYYSTINSLRVALALLSCASNCTADENIDAELDQKSLGLILLQLCEVFYSNMHMYSFCEWLVDHLIEKDSLICSEPHLKEEDFEALDRACNSSMGALRLAVSKGSLQGYMNINFDPSMQQNVPFVIADISITTCRSSKIVRLLRFASPTIERYSTPATIAPEFTSFLLSLALKKKTHLYVSLQCDIPRLTGDESQRNKVIKELQKFYPNFFCIVLDQESEFYDQKGEFASLTKEMFQSLLYKRLFTEDCGYYFPEKLKNDSNYEHLVKQLIDQAAYIAFSRDGSCSSIKRSSCIEIFHAILILFSIKYLEVDSANVSCKDSIDRAMKTLAIMLKIASIASGKSDDTSTQKIIKVFTLAPAFIVKKQAMNVRRRTSLLSALALLDSSKGHSCVNLCAENWGIRNPDIIVKKSGTTKETTIREDESQGNEMGERELLNDSYSDYKSQSESD